MIDIHMHILPDIDDGAETWEQAEEMAALAVAAGTSGIVCTPHQCDGLYNVANEQVERLTAELANRLVKANISLDLHAGGDVQVQPSILDDIGEGRAMTIGGGPYMLVEMPHSLVPEHFADTLFSLQVNGYIPIITHPERNLAIQENNELLSELVHGGSLAQLTAGALVGDMGDTAQRCAVKFLDKGWCHLIASDAHNCTGRAPGLAEAREIVAGRCGYAYAEEMFDVRPRQIVEGQRALSFRAEAKNKKKKNAPGMLARLFGQWRAKPVGTQGESAS